MRVLVLVVAASSILALASCSPSGTRGNGDSTFSKSYGGPLHDDARNVVSTADGGFVLFGSAEGSEPADTHWHESSEQRGHEFWLQKLDANGNVELAQLIGSRALTTGSATRWRRAITTRDGGTLLVGGAGTTRRVLNGAEVLTSSDVAIAKLDAAGELVWQVQHDSGPWQNYDYFELGDELAAARDVAIDVAEARDGSFLIAGKSTANLEDRLGVGFPCEDAELADITSDAPCEDAIGQVGNRFRGAYSAIVMRVDANGGLLWVRRTTDTAFDIDAQDYNRGEQIRVVATSDEGAAIVRLVPGGAIAHRFGADGSHRWRTVIEADFVSIQTAEAAALIQTDDPVDGPDNDRPDGVADDGFAFTGGDTVVKLAFDGRVEWSEDLRGGPFIGPPPWTFLDDLVQVCDAGRTFRCDLVVVGSKETSEGGPYAGTVFVLEADGNVREELRHGAGVAFFRRVVSTSGGVLELLGEGAGRVLMRTQLTVPTAPATPTFGGLVVSASERASGHSVDEFFLRPDGSVLALTHPELAFLDATLTPVGTLDLVAPEQSDILRAGVQLSSGRLVLAGSRSVPSGEHGIVALGIDLDTTGARIAWQNLVVADDAGDAFGAVPSADGGVLLGVFATLAPDAASGPALLKLDAGGNLLWTASLGGGSPIALAPLRDGGAALVIDVPDSSEDTGVVRVSSSGAVVWRQHVGARLQALTETAGGELLVAGASGATLNWVRLAADGAGLAAGSLALPISRTSGAQSRGQVSLRDMRVGELADGGFVFAMTESGLFDRSDGPAGTTLLTYGGRNALVARVDASMAPLWAHVYGGLHDEGVRDLSLRADGTIAVAGYSDSFGDRREAWLLKLAPDGLVRERGCNAWLGSIGIGLIQSRTEPLAVQAVSLVTSVIAELAAFAPLDVPMRAPTDFVTARQCTGSTDRSPPGTTARLTINQVGARSGAVTSAPLGISCGTGLNRCAADFPLGSRVALRADVTGFLGWRSPCDEQTGGTSLDCVVHLSADRAVDVEFGGAPPPTPRFTLTFDVQGSGMVQADGGISCGPGRPPAECSATFDSGTIVSATALPGPVEVFLGWDGDAVCRALGTQAAVQIGIDRDLNCIARFGPPTHQLLAVSVSGNGAIWHTPSGAALYCRPGSPPADCEELFATGTTVTLNAAADAGHVFAGWGGDCASFGVSAQADVSLTQSRSCTATFIPAPPGSTLTVQVVNDGAGRIVQSQPPGIDCGGGQNDCSETYSPLTLVLLRASLGSFQGWQGCDRVVDVNFCEVTLNGSRNVSALYAP